MTKQLPSEMEDFIYSHRLTIAAASSSLISTVAGYPLDAVKSRLQVQRYPSIFNCIQRTFAEEGLYGFFRGVGIPLLTITIVRTTSFSIYDFTKRSLRERYNLDGSLKNTAILGFAGGATGGILISFGSCAFELAKVRAQLEYLMAQRKGVAYVPSGTIRGAVSIYRRAGVRVVNFHMIWATVRKNYPDTLPFGLPSALAPFACGSSAGIFSWMLIYPVDLVKTRVQRDALEGVSPRPSAATIFRRLSSKGFTRLYRGLGISAFRSMFTHGLQWTLLEKISTGIAARHEQLSQAVAS